MVLRNEKYEDITVSTVYIIDTINQTHSLQLLWYYIFLLIKWYYIIDFVVIYISGNVDILLYVYIWSEIEWFQLVLTQQDYVILFYNIIDEYEKALPLS